VLWLGLALEQAGWRTSPYFTGMTKYCKAPQRTTKEHNKDRKGPQRSITKDCKGPLGTAKDRKEVHRIFNLVVILSNATLIHLLAAVRKKLLLLSSSLFIQMTPGWCICTV